MRHIHNIVLLYCIIQFHSIEIINGFNLYKSEHPHKRTTRLFDRLSYHETIKLKHNQFHHIDTGPTPIYPMNGKIEFHAFGRYYRLLIRQNLELFSDNFVIEHHIYNNKTNKIERHQSKQIPKCHYTAQLKHDKYYILNPIIYK